MSHVESSAIAKLIDAVNENRFSSEDIERRLIAQIEMEYQKGDQADIQIINACEDLLNELSKTPVSFVSHKQIFHQAIDEAAKPRKKAAGGLRKRIVIVAVAAAVLLCSFVTATVFPLHWLEGSSTEDEQQYFIQGHEIDIATIESCIAENADVGYFFSDNLDEVITFLGFQPNVIASRSIDWRPTTFEIFVTQSELEITTIYHCANEKHTLLHTTTMFLDMNDAYLAFEQNKKGTTAIVQDSDVYITKNKDRYTFCWHIDNEINMLSGDITEKDGIQFIKQLLGGNVE